MRAMDAANRRMQIYTALPSTKKRRAAQNQKKIQEELAADRKAAASGLDYGSGIAVQPAVDDKDKDATAAASVSTTKVVICNRCGKEGHARSTSKKCQFYVAPKKRNSSGHIKDAAVSGVTKNFT